MPSWMRYVRRSTYRVTALASIALVAAGCEFNGLNSLDMPGTAGHGERSFVVTMNLPNVAGLPQNSPVKVRDVTVGSVSGINVVQRADGSVYATARLSLNADVDLPANTVAMVAQTTLLGSQHVELSKPTDQPLVGKLADGAVLDSPSTGRYATTEEVLSALGTLVNNGNLGAVQDITTELSAAVGSATLTDLVPKLAMLTASFSQQTADIVALTDAVDRIAGVLVAHTDALQHALADLPAALRVLNENRTNIVDALAAVKKLAIVASNVMSQIKTDFAADMTDLYPVIKALNDNRADMVSSLPLMPTFPFPAPSIPKAVRGDFLNSFATFDLTLRRLGENLLTTSPFDPNMKHLSEVVNAPDWLIGAQANLSGQAADPFKIPPGTASGREGPG